MLTNLGFLSRYDVAFNRIISILAFCAFCALSAFSQADSSIVRNYCGTTSVMETWLDVPENRSLFNNHEGRLYHSFRQGAKRQSAITLPVVVHIVHANGPENISDAQVIAGIDHLNAGFAYLNDFKVKGPGFDTQFSFCLARQDPSGNPTSGITRTPSPYSSLTLETEDILLKDQIRWDPTQYINIWVVKEINSAVAGPGVAGYAYFPSSHGTKKDGIVLEASYMGSSLSNSSVLVHEMGHYLGLYHTFEGGCLNDDCLLDGDRICDTPPDKSTAHIPCSGTVNTCQTDVLSGMTIDQDDFTWDFMDYSSLNCYSGFTSDQSERMHWFTENIRSSLLDSKACLDPCVSLSQVKILGPADSIPVGSMVTFDQLSNGATSFQWSINGIPLGTNTVQDYFFDQVGTYIISLEAFNTDPNCYRHDTLHVHVTCPVNALFTYTLHPDQSVSLQSTSTGMIGDLHWEATQNSVSSTIAVNTNSLVHTFPQPGWTTICLTVLPPGNLCQQTFCQNLFIPDTSSLPNSILQEYYHTNSIYYSGNRYHQKENAYFCPGSEWSNNTHYATLSKIDPCGEVIWSRAYAEDEGFAYLSDVLVMNDGHLLICGGHCPTGNGMDETSNFFMKIDAVDGSVHWSRTFSYTDRITNIRMVPSLNDPIGESYYLAHWIHKGNFADDGGLIKIDPNGAILWNRKYSIPNSDFEISAIKSLPLGKLALFGQTGTPFRAHAVLLDSDGTIEQTKFYTGPGIITCSFRSGELCPDGSFLVHGFVNTQKSGGQDKDWFMAKLSSNLDLVWMNRYDTPWQMDGGESIRLTDGSILFLSEFQLGPDKYPGYIRTNDLGQIADVRRLDQSWPALQNPQPRLRISSTKTMDELIVLGLERRFEAGARGLLAGYDPASLPCLATPESVDMKAASLSAVSMNLLALPFTYQWGTISQLSNRSLSHALLCGSNPCMEDCSNGIDDDQNGLVDCFDPACPCSDECLEHYYPSCPNECPSVPPCDNLAMLTRWETAITADGPPTILAGTLDGAEPVLIVTQPGLPNLSILDGLTGQLLKTMPVPNKLPIGSFPAIGDVDHDGTSEIFLVDETNHLVGLEHDGTIRFISTQPVGTSGNPGQTSIQLTDLNTDGTPEICIGTSIFNASTGEQLHANDPTLSSGTHPEIGQNILNGIVVAEVYPSESCSSCSGLELVCGNQVFGISPDNQSLTLLSQAANGLMDGWTSLADIDLDGDVDAVVVTASNGLGICYGWDLLTGQILGSYSFPSAGIGSSRVAIGDIDGDLFPDLVFLAYPKLIALDHTFNLKWESTIQDFTSLSQPVLFDLCSSGANQIIIQGDQAMYVVDGTSGMILSSTPTQASLPMTHPVVVDCNQDGQAEVITCTLKKPNEYAIVAFSSANASWADSRTVWNQASFHNTHVEENLDIPLHYQEHIRVSGPPSLNTFLTAVSIRPSHSPDASIEIADIGCTGDSILLTFLYCNQGTGHMPTRIPVTLYQEHAASASAVPIGTYIIQAPLHMDSCRSISFLVPIQPDGLYSLVVNDPGMVQPPLLFAPNNFPPGIRECNYVNNIDTFRIALSPLVLDIGPDTSICASDALLIEATPGFQSYTWHTGWNESKLTVEHPGLIWVEAADQCGRLQRDSAWIALILSPPMFSSADTSLCAGSTLELTVSGFNDVQWIFNDSLLLQSPGPFVLDPVLEGTLVAIAILPEGCVVIDTMDIHVWPDILVQNTTTICAGDTLVLNGSLVTSPDTLVEHHIAANGCDSLITHVISVHPPAQWELIVEHPCQEPYGAAYLDLPSGSSLWDIQWTGLGGQTVDPQILLPGTYQVNVLDSHACLTSRPFDIIQPVPPDYAIDILPISCTGWMDGQIHLSIQGEENYLILLDGETYNPGAMTFGAGTYLFSITDTLGCIYQDTIVLTDPPPVFISLPPDTTLVLGNSILITPTGTSANGTYSWEPPAVLDCSTCASVNATPYESGWINLQYLSSLGCPATDSMYILVQFGLNIYIPNAFSPNDDGINDLFKPYFPSAVKAVSNFDIYDRWGEWVHSQTDLDPQHPALGWDGSFRGKKLDPGIFVYKIELLLINDEPLTLSGELHLIR